MSAVEPARIDLEQCPACGAPKATELYRAVKDLKYRVPGSWSFVRCVCCEVVYLNPRPVDPRSGYPDHYVQHASAEAADSGRSSLRATVRRLYLASHGYGEARPLHRLLGSFIGYAPILRLRASFDFLLFPRFQGEGRLLDVGCGNGRYLATMKRLGWDVYGVEPDSASAAQARGAVSCPVFETLEDAAGTGQTFDVITMNHVLEHIPEPKQALALCAGMLDDDGCLGIVVPNEASLGHRMFRDKWYALEPPRHVLMYSPFSLSLLVRGAGMEIRRLRTVSLRQARVAFDVSWTFAKGRSPSRTLSVIAGWAMILFSRLLRSTGEEILLWARAKAAGSDERIGAS